MSQASKKKVTKCHKLVKKDDGKSESCEKSDKLEEKSHKLL